MIRFYWLFAICLSAGAILSAPGSASAWTSEGASGGEARGMAFTSDPDEPLDNLSDNLSGQDQSLDQPATRYDTGNMMRSMNADEHAATVYAPSPYFPGR